MLRLQVHAFIIYWHRGCFCISRRREREQGNDRAFHLRVRTYSIIATKIRLGETVASTHLLLQSIQTVWPTEGALLIDFHALLLHIDVLLQAALARRRTSLGPNQETFVHSILEMAIHVDLPASAACRLGTYTRWCGGTAAFCHTTSMTSYQARTWSLIAGARSPALGGQQLVLQLRAFSV